MSGKPLSTTFDWPLSCEQHHLFERFIEQAEDYWKSPAGISRRINQLAQNFSYKVVNNAQKIYGQTGGARWLRWEDAGDAKVCADCERHARGGDGRGYYRPWWFLPAMPVHSNCRCQWEIIYEEPLTQTRLP